MKVNSLTWILTVTMALPTALAAKASKPMAPLLAKVKAAKSQAHLRQALLAFSTSPASLDSLFSKAGTDDIYCAYIGKGGMTFAIRKSKVLFTHFNVESCGLTIDGHSRIDTLGFENGVWSFKEGAVQDSGEPLNRLDFAE